MGIEVNNTSSPNNKYELKDYFNDLFAYALSIGMSSKEYWDDDPELLAHYVKAEKIRQRKMNTQLWLQGAYIYQAIGCLSPVLNGFSKEHKAQPYLKEPICLNDEERIERENAKVEKFRQQLIARVNKGGQK